MAQVKIRCRPNGPLLIEGSIEIEDSQGNPVPVDPTRPANSLCRCGNSQNKPFCDGSHKRTDWKESPGT